MMGRIILAASLAFCASVTARAADEELISAARKEGEVVWLGTMAVNDLARPLIRGFEAKYGIKVLYERKNVTDIVLKVTNEAAAGRHSVDVVDGTFTSQALKTKGLLLEWLPEKTGGYPEYLLDKHRTWVALNVFYATPSFNSDIIPKGQEPRTLEDLLNPRFKGQIAWSSVAGSATGAGFIGAILRYMGEEKGSAYLHQLAAQQIISVPVQARALLDQVISGEYPIILQAFNSQTIVAKAKGAPVEWIPMSPATGVLIAGSVIKDAPHPAAAKLLLDYLASDEGQRIFRDRDYIPADPHIEPLDPAARPDGAKFQALFFPPEEVMANMPRWTEIYNRLFR